MSRDEYDDVMRRSHSEHPIERMMPKPSAEPMTPPDRSDERPRAGRDQGAKALSRPKALDLFCGAGGASMGLHRAGFDVTGIDIKPQPRYPFRFIQGDALNPPVRLSDFDLVWASPPCQRWAASTKTWDIDKHPDLIEPIRVMLAGRVSVIENVLGAPLVNPIVCCGSGFGLEVWRHRAFELHGFTAPSVHCDHGSVPWPFDVTGTGGRRKGERVDGRGGNPRKPNNISEASRAMNIDWMRRAEISQAVPPAYSAWIGHYAMLAIRPEDAIEHPSEAEK